MANMDTTGIVLGVIFGLVAMVIAILKYNNDRQKAETERLVEQAKTNLHLEQIQKDVIEIKLLMCKYDERLQSHAQEINEIKNEIKNLKKKEGK
jgi:cell division protein FtsB